MEKAPVVRALNELTMSIERFLVKAKGLAKTIPIAIGSHATRLS